LTHHPPDTWADGAAYEAYIGRWSRLVAREFLDWLAVPSGSRWLDVGCGTGMLTRAILEQAAPREVVGIDPSGGFLAYARAHVPEALFEQASAQALPFEAGWFNAVVSGLALNFVPDARAAVAEMVRVTASGGSVALYVWDYAEGMQLMRYFFDAAAVVDPASVALDEGRRFPLCRPEPLRELFSQAGLRHVSVRPVDIPMPFADFDELWRPFLGGQGAAPSYVARLDDATREAIRARFAEILPRQLDGSIHLTARAWAIRGQT
jgi:SAM-dependent methyltransferase